MTSKSLPAPLITAIYGLLLLLALSPIVYHRLHSSISAELVLDKQVELESSPASMILGYACADCQVAAVHGANAIETRDGGLFATWFGGSREGGKDVVLWGANFDTATGNWSKPRQIIGPAETQSALGRYIKTVGNSVLVRGTGDELWLYYVSVSMGGWAGSALNVTRSVDEGKSWSAPSRIISSPFANISTLNKSPAVHYADGSIALPVYHEFIGKFSEFLYVDSHGKVTDKARITSGRHSIQPVVLPLSPNEALALMRDTGPHPGRVLLSRTADGGQHWTVDERSALPNPDSAVAGVRRPDGSLLLVFNDVEAGRNSLALAVSRDKGVSWKILKHFERDNDVKSEFSYPYLIRASNGTMHLLYTWNRKRIRHVAFNDSWVNGVQP